MGPWGRRRDDPQSQGWGAWRWHQAKVLTLQVKLLRLGKSDRMKIQGSPFGDNALAILSPRCQEDIRGVVRISHNWSFAEPARPETRARFLSSTLYLLLQGVAPLVQRYPLFRGGTSTHGLGTRRLGSGPMWPQVSRGDRKSVGLERRLCHLLALGPWASVSLPVL